MTKKQLLNVIAGTPDHPLVIGDIEIPCYVLEDETRVFSSRGLTGAVGLNPDAGYRIPELMASKALKPFKNSALVSAIESPILFKNPVGGGNVQGYKATLLVEICHAVLAAKDANTLSGNQLKAAKRCDILIRALAVVGVIALVDEATGYQRLRSERALATILEKFIAKELQPWTKTFPYDFYELIYKLKGWQGPDGHKRPSVIGHYTNDIVYDRLAPEILKELRKINPKLPEGGRRNRHHQWFTPDMGHPRLKEHLAAVIALMRAAPNWVAFKRNLQRAFPKLNETMPMRLEDD